MAEESIYTLAVHAGDDRSEHHGAFSIPVYNSSVFAFPDADEAALIHNELKPGYFYSRYGNPTTEALERSIAQLENGEACLALASGMAAVSAVIMTLVDSGDHIVAPSSMYSTATNFLLHLAEKFKIEITFIDAVDAENYRSAVRSNTKIFWVETPSNPLLQITDIKAITSIAKEHGIRTIVDNTFATPYNQQPISQGADAVVHSATKYLGGHSDLTAGVLVGSNDIIEKTRNNAGKFYGGNIAPQVSWLLMRGIKTLALRMERHNQNAFALANMLSDHSKVVSVFYPGLESHETHMTAKRQMKGFGGMIGFDVGSVDAGKAVVNNVKLCTLATSLGGVETVIQHSATMTHGGIPRDQRLAAGISDGLLRLSVGIEDINDLIRDLQQALEKL